MLVGTDIGGTFTDVVSYDTEHRQIQFGKTLTNYGDLVDGVFDGLAQVGVDPREIATLKHGTTQIINVLLERKGARTALITTEGFKDVLEIGRASRPLPFDLSYRRDPALVTRNLRYEVAERIDAKGHVLVPLNMDQLERLCESLARDNIEAVAISFLNSYANPTHEIKAAAFVREKLPGAYVTSGVEHSREWFEYERTSTAVANAYVGPRAASYIGRFEERLRNASEDAQFLVMASHGGILSLRRAREQPIALVESGPIGGCIGAGVYAQALGIEQMVGFDMGGTTAKCALIEQGTFDIQSTYYVGGYERGFPLRTPVLDIVEVGTGGGSIAYRDAQGRLHVGPRSAGSDPGPVCFGRGGQEPTVTDANLVLGRIGSGGFLAGSLRLDHLTAEAALMASIGVPMGFADSEVDQVAGGLLALANVQMGAAIKEVTVERGKDVREFELFAFGGGGPLHACDIARELNIGRVIVPPEPGNFSALGMLFAPARIDESRTVRLDLRDGTERLRALIAEMEANASAALRQDFGSDAVAFERQGEMRYGGQRHTIRVSLDAALDPEALRTRFIETYRQRYGRADLEAPAELVGLRVTACAHVDRPDLRALHRAGRSGAASPRSVRDVYFATVGHRLSTPVYSRYDLPVGFAVSGPAVIEEFGATCVLGPGDRLRVGELGELQIEVASRKAVAK
nr:hydantoinase/oxoprolinase family protein [Bradyrhizobium liaoningense]